MKQCLAPVHFAILKTIVCENWVIWARNFLHNKRKIFNWSFTLF